MVKQNLIKEIVRIILKYANPERIYLFGSQANGESEKTSDIDIAYDDINFKEHYLIEDEVKKMDTLLKIDIKNISKTNVNFQNRVKSTGKVLFSANKKLRVEDYISNLSKAFNRFSNAIKRKKEFYEQGYSDIFLDLIVKRFEFTYEISWKAIKRYLDYIGIDCKNPRDCFKEAYQQGLITDENIWLEMIEQRNLSSHIYDEEEISGILEQIDNYQNAFHQLINNLNKKII